MRVIQILSLALLTTTAFSANAAEQCLQSAFGQGTTFNLFVAGDLDHRSADTEGRVAVGGTAIFDHYAIGEKIVADGNPYALVVGRDLYYSNGSIWGGDIAYGGVIARFSSYDVQFSHTAYHFSPIDFSKTKAAMQTLSKALGKHGVTRAAQVAGKSITLGNEEDKSMFQVFRLRADELAEATFLRVLVAEGATVVVNVTGTSPSMKDFGFELKGVTPERMIYNFPDATKLVLSHVGVQGSILAPNADLDFRDGNIHGQLVVGRLLSTNAQVNLPLFKGCLPAEVLDAK